MADSKKYSEAEILAGLGVHGGLIESTFRNLGMDPPDKERLVEALLKAASSSS